MNYEINYLIEKINKLEKDLKYLYSLCEFKRQREREENLKKYFTYESSEDESEICCCKSLPPQQPCPEIEEYIKSISNTD